jgi:hypothetical protein
MSRFFTLPSLIAPFSRARSSSINNRIADVDTGFTKVQVEVDAIVAEAARIDASKPGLASPAFTGGVTIDGKPVATQDYVQGVAITSAIPTTPAQAGMFAKSNGAGAGWADLNDEESIKRARRVRGISLAANGVI